MTRNCGRISKRFLEARTLISAGRAWAGAAPTLSGAVPTGSDDDLPAIAEAGRRRRHAGIVRESDVDDAALRGRHRFQRDRPPRLANAVSHSPRQPLQRIFAPAMVVLHVHCDEDAAAELTCDEHVDKVLERRQRSAAAPD